MVGPVNVPDFVGGELALALNAHRTGELGVHAPVRGVEVVRAPAGDHAEAVGLVAQPAGPVGLVGLRVDAGLGVIGLLGRAEPHVVVEVGGHGLLGGVGLRGVGGQADLDALEPADTPAADKLARLAELLRGVPRALLAADLEDAAGLRHGLAQQHALGVGHRERFLEIDILAGVNGGDGDLGVPVVRQTEDDSVNVPAREQLAVVAIEVNLRPDGVGPGGK